MLGKIKQITHAQWLSLACLLVAVFIIYTAVLAITRVGEIKVAVSVIPKDAKITINDKLSPASTVYLSAGEYTFSASADGWKTDTQKINISEDSREVILLPDPESESVKDWLKNNPDIQLKREELGGERTDTQNQEILSKNPILQNLPYSQESPPFTVDYGPSTEQKDSIFLIISNSSPNGRRAALDWIRQQGEDPTDFDIAFSGFINPLSTAGVNSD